jgi:hypothetical protein
LGILLTLLLGRGLLADGLFLRPPVKVAHSLKVPDVLSQRQEALIVTDGKEHTVVLRTFFDPVPEQMAWLIPVPGRPRDVEKYGEKVFDVLDKETQPVLYTTSPSPGIKCGCSGGSTMGGRSPVTVLETGQAGLFDVAVLQARGGKALMEWLDRNGFEVPEETRKVLKPYIEEGWYWLAMKVRPPASPAGSQLTPHPVRFRYEGDLVFPLRISRPSSASRCDVLLYVLANGRYGVSNWNEADLQELAELWYRYSFNDAMEALSDRNAGRLFVTEYARQVSGRLGQEARRSLPLEAEGMNYLTRLHARMTPQAMTRDVMLRPRRTSQDVSRRAYAKVSSEGRTTIPVAALALPVLGLALVVRLGRHPKPAAMLGVLGLCLLLAG